MKGRLYLTAIVLMLTILPLMIGCDSEGASEPEKITITDDIGRTVTVEGKVERIVSLAPSNTEILFALGLGEKVVGVSQYCNYPPQATEKEQIGTLRELNYEKIAELAPDLILGTTLTGEEAMAKMEELGLTVVVLTAQGIDGVFADMELVGQITGAEEQADKLVAELRERRDGLVAKVKNVSQKPRVFIEISSLLWTVGPDTFMGAFIDLAGGANIAADSENPWPQFSAEEIIERDPEVIILADTDRTVTAEEVKARPGWEDITAVKNDAVHVVDPDIITHPGPRVIDGLEALCRIIHPEIFD